MIKYPEQLRIGPFDVKIKVIPGDLGDAQKIWGKFSRDLNIITLNGGITDPIRAVEILTHEMIHAVWAIYVIEENKDDEERIVSTMGVAWAQILRDNPHWIKWVTKTLKG